MQNLINIVSAHALQIGTVMGKVRFSHGKAHFMVTFWMDINFHVSDKGQILSSVKSVSILKHYRYDTTQLRMFG